MNSAGKTKEQLSRELEALYRQVAELKKSEAGRKKVEEELKKSNEFNFNLIEQSPHPIIVSQADSTIIRVNQALERVTGYSASELVGMKVPYPWWTEQILQEKVKRDGEAALEMKGQRFEERFKNKNGEIFWVKITPTAILVSSKPRYYLIMWTDITESKKAEEEFKKSNEFNFNLIEQSPYSVIVSEPDTSIVRVNPAFEQLTGFYASEVIGLKAPYPWWPNKVTGLRFQMRNRKLALERKGWKVESRLRKKNGEIFWVELTPTVIIIDGEPRYFLTIWTDITKRKRLEKEILEISRWEQWRIGQDLHDGLSQSLIGIAFMSKVLEQKLAAKSLPEASDVANIAQRVDQTLIQTRSLARGLLPIELKGEGLISTLEELTSNTEHLFGISCIFKHDRPIHIRGDSVATHLYFIAKEAVNNAIRHGKPQHIVISLGTINGKVTLMVENDGMGISRLSSNQGRGLHIMGYRARMIKASLDIKRGANGGTIVTCSLRNKK